ncbi:MAG TPA: carboxypeptidase-like regulatory domain-containing protein [Thermoanaerobaculia bacterium]
MMIPLLVLWLSSIAGSSEPADAVSVRPATQITGRVVTVDRKPIANARIVTASTFLARTDRAGRFAFPLPDPAPAGLSVESKSYATRSIAFPHGAAVSSLGDIVLMRAVSVTVDVSNVRGVRELSLVPVDERRSSARAMTKKVAGRKTKFEGLQQGQYVLTARGDGPLQQKSQIVNAGEPASERVVLQVDRMPLRGYVFLGREPLAGADLTISGPTSSWTGKLRTDADGFFEAELWQVGAMKAAVRSPRLALHFTTGTRADDALERGAVEWNIAIPDRGVTGRIVDDTGAPVAKAAVTVDTEDGELRSNFRVVTDAAGDFRFDAAPSGRYALQVRSPHHLTPETTRFELQDDDPHKRVEIVVERGVEVAIRVQREDGTPVAGATVASDLDDDGAKAMLRLRTSESGAATLRGRAGEQKTLYVIPPDGSFAVVRMTLDAEALEHGIDITTPEARSALIIRTRDEKGIALDGIGFVVRYNGELLPAAIMQLIRFVQHVDYRTNPAGEARIHGLPSGEYELWAYRTASEAERLVANPSGYPPSLQLAVASGTYEADLTFGQ